MRVAVTGAAGRLGAALVTRLSNQPSTFEACSWRRSDFDLDAPGDAPGRIASDQPDLVIHSAAWTDVDGCARDPELAMRRNGEAATALARACAAAGVDLIIVSTNEVFDGDRTDGRGYRTDDSANPQNAYGRSKLAGEVGAGVAFERFGSASHGPVLGIVRTTWLFGPGKPDFPAKILAAARGAAAEGRPLRVVNDEFGTPTSVSDLADAIARLASADFHGIHHVVNAGVTSRADWARDVLEQVGVDVPIEEVSLSAFDRPSIPPRWGVLEPTPLPGGLLRPWREAMADRLLALEIAG